MRRVSRPQRKEEEEEEAAAARRGVPLPKVAAAKRVFPRVEAVADATRVFPRMEVAVAAARRVFPLVEEEEAAAVKRFFPLAEAAAEAKRVFPRVATARVFGPETEGTLLGPPGAVVWGLGPRPRRGRVGEEEGKGWWPWAGSARPGASSGAPAPTAAVLRRPERWRGGSVARGWRWRWRGRRGGGGRRRGAGAAEDMGSGEWLHDESLANANANSPNGRRKWTTASACCEKVWVEWKQKHAARRHVSVGSTTTFTPAPG